MAKQAKTTKTKPETVRPKVPGTAYLVLGIPPESWQRFGVRAKEEGRSMRWIFHQFIETYANGR